MAKKPKRSVPKGRIVRKRTSVEALTNEAFRDLGRIFTEELCAQWRGEIASRTAKNLGLLWSGDKISRADLRRKAKIEVEDLLRLFVHNAVEELLALVTERTEPDDVIGL